MCVLSWGDRLAGRSGSDGRQDDKRRFPGRHGCGGCSRGPRGVAGGGWAWGRQTWAVISRATLGAALCLSSSRQLICSRGQTLPSLRRAGCRTRASAPGRGLRAAWSSHQSGDFSPVPPAAGLPRLPFWDPRADVVADGETPAGRGALGSVTSAWKGAGAGPCV